MNCKPGDLAVIVRPWMRDEDIWRPVTVQRRAIRGQTIKMRNGDTSRSDGSFDGVVWLCEAHGDEFPCFIADCCLRPLRDSDGEDEMIRIAGLPSGVAA